MTAADGLTLREYIEVRNMLAAVLDPDLPDAQEMARAERLLDAGVVDIDAARNLQRIEIRDWRNG